MINFDKTMVDFRKIGAKFVLKNLHPEEKDEKPISNTIKSRLNNVFCYSCNKTLRKIGKVNIWKG